ncbi:hypothetical protein [Desulfobacula sp.]
MQQIQKMLYEKCLVGITGTAWVAGLLIAGSDSPYMPWLNGMGLMLFLGASILLGKLLGSMQQDSCVVIYPKFYQKPGINAMKSEKRNQKTNVRCAVV